MIALPLKKRFNGYNYTQRLRNGYAAIYEQTVASDCKYYEVFAIIRLPEKVIKGKLLPEREKWPKDEDFGYTAWTKRTLDEAIEKFAEISGFSAEKISKIVTNLKNNFDGIF